MILVTFIFELTVSFLRLGNWMGCAYNHRGVNAENTFTKCIHPILNLQIIVTYREFTTQKKPAYTAGLLKLQELCFLLHA